MWTAIGLALKAAASGAWTLLRAIPAWVYMILLAAVLIAWGQHRAYTRGHAAGIAVARADLIPKLTIALDQLGAEQEAAADAEGRALALDAGLQACIGERDNMATITSAVLSQRTRAAAQAQHDLAATRQELSDAYTQSADGCSGQPVPAGVLGVLDHAAARAAGPDAHSNGVGAGPAARSGPGRADDADACAAAPWINVARFGGLDRGLGGCAAAVQCGQGQRRGAEG